ncbi:MAG: ribosomal 40S subunit protein S24B [Paramarteilia canceri]
MAATPKSKILVERLSFSDMLFNPCFNRTQLRMSFTASSVPPRKLLRDLVAKQLKVSPNVVMVYEVKASFANRPMNARAHVYKSVNDLMNSEPKTRLYRESLLTKPKKSSRQDVRKHKNKIKKLRGKEKVKVQKLMDSNK